MATNLISEAHRQAIEKGRPVAGQLLHQSDRGCQYTGEAFQEVLKTLQITQPMSCTGCCYDNPVAERFFWSLKHEWTKFGDYADLEDANLSVFWYIETFYSSVRLHQTLNYISPDHLE